MEIVNSVNPYWIVIGISLIIILSYGFNMIAQKTNIPSVIMLIVTGVLIESFILPLDSINMRPALEFLGIVGLIMIVLEAALDLELVKSKAKLIAKALLIAILLLFLTSFTIAFTIKFFYQTSMYQALAYAIPLSIMSSAIIIPSVGNLIKEQKEFLIFEAAFSDIIGIMFFYFLVDTADFTSTQEVAFHVFGNIVITLLVAVLLGFAIILLIQRVTAQLKLFLPIAVLMLLYSIGKLYHLSSLIFVLAFGLMLNNRDLFFRGKLRQLFVPGAFKNLLYEIKLLTLETSFLIRTFFFIVFGMSITLTGANELATYLIAAISLILIFGLRIITLNVFQEKEEVYPAFYVAPRGLVTVLLFFAIPKELEISTFRPGILLLVIIGSSLVMMYGLIRTKKKATNSEDVAEISSDDEGIDILQQAQAAPQPAPDENEPPA